MLVLKKAFSLKTEQIFHLIYMLSLHRISDAIQFIPPHSDYQVLRWSPVFLTIQKMLYSLSNYLQLFKPSGHLFLTLSFQQS